MLVTDWVGVADAVGVAVVVGVSVIVGVTVAVFVIVSVGNVVVNCPLHVTGLRLRGKPPCGTGNAMPVRNTRAVAVSGAVVSQRLLIESNFVVVVVRVGEKLIEAPGTFKL